MPGEEHAESTARLTSTDEDPVTGEEAARRRALKHAVGLSDEMAQPLFERGVGLALEQEHRDFVRVLPTVGDAKTDSSLRWFTQSAVLLTKGAQTNVLTMGYVELNQRDSFWTSWLHVKLWPAIDLAILR